MKRSTSQLLLILLFVILGVVIVMGSPLLMFWTTSQILAIVCTYAIVVLASLLFVRLLGLRISMGNFLIGSIAAIASMGLIFAIFLAAGLVSVVSLRDEFLLILLAGVVTQLFVALGEELAFRAVMFKGLEVNLGFWPAIGISSAIFALMHITSLLADGISLATVVVGLLTLLVIGVILAMIYKYSGLLSAVAFHFFWNWLQYYVFGLSDSQGMLKTQESGMDLLTGGSFGPEASVITLIIVVCLAVALWYYYKKKGLIGAGSAVPAAV